MNQVYPEDRDLVMSKWNTLCEGRPIYFEMRWKPRSGSDDSAQWIISATVPVFENSKVIKFAGYTIDINPHKKAKQVAQERVAALELARRSELKFARFAELSPTAIFIFIPDKGMNYVNDQFFELTGHPHAPPDQIEWFDLLAEEDLGKVKEDWARMLDGEKSAGIQFRLKKTWLNQDNICSNIWVQISGYPELNENGNVISSISSLYSQLNAKVSRYYGNSVRHFAVQVGREGSTSTD